MGFLNKLKKRVSNIEKSVQNKAFEGFDELASMNDLSKDSLLNFLELNDAEILQKNNGVPEGVIRPDDVTIGDHDFDNNFKGLSYIIHFKGQKIVLNSDIILDDDEEMFQGGIYIVKDNLVIDGNGHTIDARGKTGIFNIFGKNIVFKNITFKNGNAYNGGAIFAIDSHITLENCNFESNSAKKFGGGIFGFECNIEIFDSKFEGNSVEVLGGAIFSTESLKSANCSFENNSSDRSGGTITSIDYLELNNCDFNNNNAIDTGGVINSVISEIKCIDCNFEENNSPVGGAIHIDTNSSLILENCNFEENSGELGGALTTRDSSLEIINSNFMDNVALERGGAIYIYEKHAVARNQIIKFDKCTFEDNLVKDTNANGGAIFNSKGITIDLNECTFINNSSEEMGGACSNLGIFNINNSKFENNRSKHNGGAIQNWAGGDLSVVNCDFNRNSCNENGGAINNGGDRSRANLNVSNSNFSNNFAKGGAAISNLHNSHIQIMSCNFLKNKSKEVGGAIINAPDSELNFANSNFEENEAELFGGAIYNDLGTFNYSDCNFVNNAARDGENFFQISNIFSRN